MKSSKITLLQQLKKTIIANRLKAWNRAPVNPYEGNGLYKCSYDGCKKMRVLKFFGDGPGFMCKRHFVNGDTCYIPGCFEPITNEGLCRDHWLGELDPLIIELYGQSMMSRCQDFATVGSFHQVEFGRKLGDKLKNLDVYRPSFRHNNNIKCMR